MSCMPTAPCPSYTCYATSQHVACSGALTPADLAHMQKPHQLDVGAGAALNDFPVPCCRHDGLPGSPGTCACIAVIDIAPEMLD